MKKIELTQGKVALVDDEDYEYLNQWKWHYDDHGYAVRNSPRTNGKQKTILMHRIVVGATDSMEVDHINHNRLDNRGCNLRECTRSQNRMNILNYCNNTSGKKGVAWSKSHNKWRAEIGFQGKKIRLGYYDDIEKANEAYNNATKKYFGDFACGEYEVM